MSFLSLLVWISLVNFKQGISLLKFVFSLSFPGICEFGRQSLVNFGVFLGKNQTTKERKDREYTLELQNFCPLQGSFGPFGPKVGKRVRK